MNQCAMCPNEADVYWEPTELKALTPAGVDIVAQIAKIERARVFVCAACYVEHANALGAEAERERLRRSEDPS